MHEFELREREDEDAAAAEYERLYHHPPVARYWDEDFLTFLGTHVAAGDRVLDLGCGPGSLWPLWGRLPQLERLTGVDISPRMVDEARAANPDGDFVVGRAHDLPFLDGSFDVVVASSVLHHIPDDYLDGALHEIVRVLDEHGRLVGREPSVNDFATTPGWFSGSVMSFRHLVYRLTRSREYPEPELGDHHHVFDRDAFCEILGRHLSVTRLESRFPLSPWLLRVRDERVAELAKRLDRRLLDRRGSMFYFVAEKNYVSADGLIRTIETAREQELAPISDGELLAYLEAAALEIAEIFGEPLTESRLVRTRRAGEARRGS